MVDVGDRNLTLMDHANRLDPDGSEATIVMMLAQVNEILLDSVWMEGNLPTGHQTTVQTGQPEPQFRKINGGVPVTKGETAQVTETTAMLEDFSSCDVDAANLNGNAAAFRLNESRMHLEGMSQKMAETMFYGSTVQDPASFLGLAPRYSDSTAKNGQNIIKAGGVGSDNTSIWLVGWDEMTCSCIFPKGSRAGLVHEDLGIETVNVASSSEDVGIQNARMRAYSDHYQWKAGLCLKDWRYVVRICNIDVSSLVNDPTGATQNILELMLRALHTMQNLTTVKPVFYGNRTVHAMLDIQAQNKGNLYLTAGEEEGRLKVALRGVPIRRCDVLLETEDLVV